MIITRNTIKLHSIWIILFILGVLPPSLVTIADATSYALGVFVFTLFVTPFVLRYASALDQVPFKIYVFIALFIVYSLLQHFLIGGWEKSEKSYASLFVLFYIGLIAYLSADWFNKCNIRILVKAIKILTVILILISCFNIAMRYMGLSYIYSDRTYPIFPFGEPSHYALFAGTFFLILFSIKKQLIIRVFMISITILFAFLLPSTTMLIYGVLMVLISIKFNTKNIILFGSLFCLILYSMINIDYFADRINFTEDSTNISNLVYMQGLGDAEMSMVDTNGLGLGFQMMGTQTVFSEAGLKLEEYAWLKLNREDGGFLAAKMVAELGVFGITLLIGYLYLFYRSLINLRKLMGGIENIDHYRWFIMYSVLISFSVELFVRGIGYFSPSLFLFLVALSYYFKYSGHTQKQLKYNSSQV